MGGSPLPFTSRLRLRGHTGGGSQQSGEGTAVTRSAPPPPLAPGTLGTPGPAPTAMQGKAFSPQRSHRAGPAGDRAEAVPALWVVATQVPGRRRPGTRGGRGADARGPTGARIGARWGKFGRLLWGWEPRGRRRGRGQHVQVRRGRHAAKGSRSAWGRWLACTPSLPPQNPTTPGVS